MFAAVRRDGGTEDAVDLGLEILLNRLHTARTFIRAGFAQVESPLTTLRALSAIHRWGPTEAGGYINAAVRNPDRAALHDELGTLTFAELDLRTNALAHGLQELGVVEGERVGILCRNHRGFIEAVAACSKLGAHALMLNTGFAGRQIADVCKREKPRALIFDEEFAPVLAKAGVGRTCLVAWQDSDKPGFQTLEELIATGSRENLDPPSEHGRTVVLTSGTTGTPKGVTRRHPESVGPITSILSKIPLRARETTTIAAPLFHSWGYSHFVLGLALSSTLVLQRRFDPEQTLAAIASSRASTLVVVPVMLQRILELEPEVIARYDTSSLRVISASGAALPGELALRVMDTFGDVLYNLYGSTEVAWATIATPAELRAAPGTAGTPPRGTIVKVLDSDGLEVPGGVHGRIFVGNELLFDGYNDGGTKAVIGGLMSTGDVGHLDDAGRLFISGRDDEMIISGGENVFPREVEDLLVEHEAIEDVAILGVDDEQFGQRLRAFVVLRPGATLGEEDVRNYVKDNLARFKVPRDVIFRDSLPRNSTGKVLKRELSAAKISAN